MKCKKCNGPVETTYHWLRDMYGDDLCHACIDLIYFTQQESFRRHLEEATRIVSTWPEWKQHLL